MIEHLLAGFATAISPSNLFFCFFGVTMGTIIGVLPGIGPVAGTAMLIPFRSLASGGARTGRERSYAGAR